jgi:hypothetical protein
MGDVLPREAGVSILRGLRHIQILLGMVKGDTNSRKHLQ